MNGRLHLVLAGAVLAAVPCGAAEEGPAAARSWRGWMGADGSTAFDAQHATFAAAAGGDLYLRPLVDDGEAPLSLLRFLHHTGAVSVGVSGSAEGARVGGGALAFPWGDTGLSGFGGVAYRPDTARVTLDGGALFVRYLAPQLRGTLGVIGTRQSGTDFLGTFFGARCTLSQLVGHSLLELGVDVGPVRVRDSPSFFIGGSAAATFYFGRRWSLSLDAGFSEQVYLTATGPGPATQTERFGVGGRWWVTEAVSLAVSWAAIFRQRSPGLRFDAAAPFTAEAPFHQSLGLGVGWRL